MPKNIIGSYFEDKRMFNSICYMDKANDVLNALHNLGFEIYIVSIGSEQNLEHKKRLLSTSLPFVEFIGVDESKYPDKSHIDMSEGIFIDDRNDILQTSNADFKIVFGEEYSWNQNTSFHRCYNWLEILLAVTKIYCLDNKAKEKEEKLEIKYHTDIDRLEYIEGKSDWIDLRAAETVRLCNKEYKAISLGVSIKLPKGYEAQIIPRSSTYQNFGIIQVNSVGVIDNTYCGDKDIWHFPAFAVRDTTINKNDRICQFRIVRNQPKVNFVEVENLRSENRGGFGSTGVN